MASKKQHEQFNKQVEKILVSMGAKANETKFTSMYKWQLDTRFGILIITVHEPEKSQVFSVYSQFVDYDKYENELKNISGHWKYNVHQYTAEMAISSLIYKLNLITTKN